MDEKQDVNVRHKPTGAAVCAHLGIGVDDEQAKLARDRLNKSLAHYRVALLAGEQAEAEVVGA
ncbi:hypothetical protein [Saccharopolyspora dendranthemae]|uniref:Uncharacterized protein n=1 Tax=Saccharopolyspora dendranthemae TaxID=1181886 RepID=A0A561U503_9PSEU|nr:hypothetical protein [Saccharopolyspora dendranthemae]TWF94442.1 hypothetical protein FHU35_13149 [Saccharopolyspora dendranthemae]